MRTAGHGRNVTRKSRCRGLTLLEIMVAMVIVSLLAALAIPEYQKYQYRSRAAGIVVESGPIKRAIEFYMNTVGQGGYKPQLANGTDQSIVGCKAPAGVRCGEAGAGPVEPVVPKEQLLISLGSIRVLAALCEVDCPSYALSYTSDLNATGTAALVPPAPASSPAGSAPATPPAATPADEKELKRLEKEKGKGKKAGIGPWLPLVSSAHAQTDQFQATNRMLYEFGELMRKRVHSADNATCLAATGPCTVTLKF